MAQKKQSDKKIDREIRRVKKEIEATFKKKEKLYKDQLKRIKKIQEKPRGLPAWERPKSIRAEAIKSKRPKIKQYSKSDMERMKKFYGDIDRTKLAKFKKVPKKSLAKRLVGKTLAKAIPGAGAAIIAHDVMRAGAKKGCIKRGGKWVGGKCQVAKKSRKKTGGPDPRFAKSRRTKAKK